MANHTPRTDRDRAHLKRRQMANWWRDPQAYAARRDAIRRGIALRVERQQQAKNERRV